jgi:glutathione S-transferase
MGLVTVNDEVFKVHLDHYKYPDRYGSDRVQHRDAALAILSELDARLACNGKLIGSHYALTDIAILPFVRQFAAVDEGWFATQAINHVQVWLSEFLASKLFDDAMMSVPVWKVTDSPLQFPLAVGD